MNLISVTLENWTELRDGTEQVILGSGLVNDKGSGSGYFKN